MRVFYELSSLSSMLMLFADGCNGLQNTSQLGVAIKSPTIKSTPRTQLLLDAHGPFAAMRLLS